jgi:6-phosphofructokinase 2
MCNPAVPARSTIGAGYSTLAGIILDLSRGLPLHEDARFGIAAGAAALLGSGTKLCRRADVERLYNDGSCRSFRGSILRWLSWPRWGV